MVFRFSHESLDCYKLAVEVARWFQHASFPKGRTELKQQGQEAADSTVLNMAEGSGRRRGATDAGKNHHGIAVASASECCAVLDLVPSVTGASERVLVGLVQGSAELFSAFCRSSAVWR